MVSNKVVSIRPLREGIAVMDNKLLDACYSMTVTQKRLFNMAVAAVNSKKTMVRNNSVAVSIDDFAQLSGLTRKAAIEHIKNTLPDMRQAHVVDVVYKDKNTFKKTDGSDVERISYKNFFQEVDYVETNKELAVKFKFSDWLVPYIAQLRRSFTRIHLQHVNPLNSFYSMRLYEAVIMKIVNRDGFHVRSFEISELRSILGLQDGVYERWVDMKKACLVRPINELNKKTPFKWNLDVNGRGKYLRSVTVSAQPKSQQEMDL